MQDSKFFIYFIFLNKTNDYTSIKFVKTIFRYFYTENGQKFHVKKPFVFTFAQFQSQFQQFFLLFKYMFLQFPPLTKEEMMEKGISTVSLAISSVGEFSILQTLSTSCRNLESILLF